MRINMDFEQRVVIDTEGQDWVESPASGVQRRMLDREAAETGRATTIVRFAPESYFPAHSHPGGEEFLVLEGVFSDESGDYGQGMYVRNPVGSAHQPFTKDGCVILVKLWQMDPGDQEFVHIDTSQSDGWHDGDTDGISVRDLHVFGDERVSLAKLQPGTRQARRDYPGGAEYFVVEGALGDENGHYGKGTWLRLPANSGHNPFSDEGCTVFIKTGHLSEADK